MKIHAKNVSFKISSVEPKYVSCPSLQKTLLDNLLISSKNYSPSETLETDGWLIETRISSRLYGQSSPKGSYLSRAFSLNTRTINTFIENVGITLFYSENFYINAYMIRILNLE